MLRESSNSSSGFTDVLVPGPGADRLPFPGGRDRSEILPDHPVRIPGFFVPSTGSPVTSLLSYDLCATDSRSRAEPCVHREQTPIFIDFSRGRALFFGTP